jgi:glycosyltransferase involved in cell wall biosynthesis
MMHSQKRIRVLHLQNHSNWGGNLMGIQTLLAGMDTRRFRVFFGAPKKETYIDKFKNLNLEIIDSEFKSKHDLNGLFRLLQTIRRRKINILHSHVQITDLMTALAGKLCPGLKTVTTVHAPININEKLQRDKSIRGTIYSYILRHGFDRIITVSKALHRELIHNDHIDLHKIVHIINGIDPNPFKDSNREKSRDRLGLDPNKKVVVMVAWFGLRKGHHTLIDSAVHITRKIPDVLFLLVGEGRLKKTSMDRVRQWGLQDNFVFLGYREDIPDILATSDLAVLPSVIEGLPRNLLEAMAAGLPVVASRLDGIAELVVHEKTGLLTDPGSASALSQAIAKLLGDPQRCKEMGLQGRRRVENHFRSDQMVQATEQLYEQLMNQ